MKLYELTESYNKILELIEEGGEGLEDTLEALEDAIEDKAENYAKVIKTLEAQAKMIKEEEQRLSDRRKALENHATNMKLRLEDELRKVGLDKVKGLIFTVAIQKNPPSLNVLDESKIPAQYWVPQSPTLDRKGLLDFLKQGNSVEWAEIKQGESLRIR